jgi:hypothetical protein
MKILKSMINTSNKPHRGVEDYLENLERVAENEYEAYGGMKRLNPHAQHNRFPQRRSSVTGQKYTPRPDVQWKSGTQALIDIVVTRLTTNLAGIDLPFAIFGFTFVPTQYFGLISTPSGLTFSVDVSNPLRLDFVWTNGIVTDRVRVSTTQTNYVSFLQGLASDMFQVEKVRMTLSDTTNTDQFNRSIELGEKTMFGKRSFNPIPVQSLKSPYQQQTNIIDLGTDEKPLNWGVDKNVVLLSQIKAVENFSVTYSTFISNLERLQYSMM